jgi:hypothetical protein
MRKVRPNEKDSFYHMVPREYILPLESEDTASHLLATHLPYPDNNECSKENTAMATLLLYKHATYTLVYLHVPLQDGAINKLVLLP